MEEQSTAENNVFIGFICYLCVACDLYFVVGYFIVIYLDSTKREKVLACFFLCWCMDAVK